jgi:hypothetical protein
MKPLCHHNAILFILILTATILHGCTFDVSGIPPLIDSRFDGCWENTDIHEVWGRVVMDLNQHDSNLVTGILFVRAESIATLIPYSLEGEVAEEGMAVLQASLHATPDESVGVALFLPVPPTPADEMTFQMAGKPTPPPLSECP